MNSIQSNFSRSVEVKQKLLQGTELDVLLSMGDVISDSIKNGGKLLLCGNGGSAADAQHLAAEFLIRLRPMNNREGIAALTLAQDTSTITACGNDFGYEKLYERVIKSIGQEGDVLLGISTSGNSENVNLALMAAKDLGITSCGFLGAGGGIALKLCDNAFVVPSNETGRIQEAHITAGHALMEYVEDKLIEDGYLHLESS